jgi:hypothetical protein
MKQSIANNCTHGSRLVITFFFLGIVKHLIQVIAKKNIKKIYQLCTEMDHSIFTNTSSNGTK